MTDIADTIRLKGIPNCNTLLCTVGNCEILTTSQSSEGPRENQLIHSAFKNVNIVYVIESAAYGVLFTSCLCQKPERARYERVRAFDTNNE